MATNPQQKNAHIAKVIAQKMYHAVNLLHKGRATPEQFLAYLIRNAKSVMKAAPQFNPDYKPQHVDETPEGLAQLNAIGKDEVLDEDLNQIMDDEAPEDIDFGGGGQFDSDI